MHPRRALLILLTAALLLRISLMFFYYHGDMYNHVDWGEYALHHGFYGIYERPDSLWKASYINQPPGSIYIFTAMRGLFEFFYNIVWWINNTFDQFPSGFILFYENKFNAGFMKLPAIIADVGLGYLIYLFVKQYTDHKKALLSAGLYLFNPVAFYNSAWWGQTDATVNFFGLLALYLLLKKKILPASFALAASLFIKASLLIFVPIFALVAYHQRYGLKNILYSIFLPLSTVFVLAIPFHDITDPLWLLRIYKDQVVLGTLNNVTENAFNIWALFYGIDPQTPNTVRVLGIQAVHTGYALFAASYIGIVYYLTRKITAERILISLITISFSSFLFLTGIHERYLFPIFPLFAVLLALQPSLLPLYIAITIVHFTNLYHLWWSPHVKVVVAFLKIRGVMQILCSVLLALFVIYVQQTILATRRISQKALGGSKQ